MGFLKDSFQVINYVFTLGGSEELNDAQESYDAIYDRYKLLHDHLQAIQDKIDHDLKLLGNSLILGKKALKKSEKILRCSNTPLQISNLTSQSIQGKADRFNSSFNTAVGTGFGGIVGGSTALGAWAVVSVLGSASTGTAIAGLSGVAATNATLAWFGGGALAAGGAGMSGGMMVLGGIVAAPMVYFAAKGAYAKAEKVREETEKIKDEYNKLLKIKATCEANQKEVKITVQRIIALTEVFTKQVEIEYSNIRPYGALSYLRQRIWRMFGLRVHNKKSLNAIKNLEVTTDKYLEYFLSQT